MDSLDYDASPLQTRPPAGMQPFTLRHSAFAHHMQRSPYLSLLLQQPQ